MASLSLFPEEPQDEFSDRLPSQLVTYHPFNWTGRFDSGPQGEWLRCNKATGRGVRQFIWQDNAIRGIVTFAGWVRDAGGFYEGWGGITHLPLPVVREVLMNDPRTRTRFDGRGIKAFQGSPIKIPPALGEAIVELLGGLPATEIPVDEPDYHADVILWAGPHGLPPEAYIEAAVASERRLWRRLGFPEAPYRQVCLGPAGRADLLRGGVVGETKRAVTISDGPDQIERYLDHMRRYEGWPRGSLKGVLLQCADDTSQAVVDRLRASRYTLELWSVIDDDDGGWYLDRLA